jgi:cell division protease FtsH
MGIQGDVDPEPHHTSAQPLQHPWSDPDGGGAMSVEDRSSEGTEGREGLRRRPSLGGILWLVLTVAAVGYWVWSSSRLGAGEEPRVSYSTSLALVEDDAVLEVVLRDDDMRGVLKEERDLTTEDGDTVRAARFRTTLPPVEDPAFISALREHGVEIAAEPGADSSWLGLLLRSLIPLAILLVIWMVVLGRMRGGGQGILAVGRSGAKLYDRSKERTTFDDVAGAKAAKQELAEIVDFLRRPERFRRLGAEIPKGVLLVGPPGTGKTLLARAVAGEADVPFFSITGSDFMEMFVGVGPKRVRDLFEGAKRAAPSIIFIDELDAIGGRRGAGVWVGGADERERTLNQLLSEMSGFEPSESVIVLAATNRPDVLDSALLRPGRFDRRVNVDLPTQGDRAQILRLHARRMTLAPDVDLDAVARGTPGFSGADLKNLLNEAALLAARREAERIAPEDLDEARDKVLLGLEREGLALTDRELRYLSYHEAGHAVLATVLPRTDPLHKVTIVPRGRAMGVTQQLPETERYIYEREYILDRMTVMLGGRAAEELMCQTFTSGAEDDLHQAVALARRMVVDWGMSEQLGPLVLERSAESAYLGVGLPEMRNYSEESARRADEATKSILDACYARALTLLRQHRASLTRIADRLLEVEELTGEEVVELVKRGEAVGGTEERSSRRLAGSAADVPETAWRV